MRYFSLAPFQCKNAFCYVAIKVGVSTRSHVEPFRCAGFKDRATDGAASELGKGKEAASETERLILSEWKTIAEEETITVSEREPDGGRKETKRAPTEGRKGDVVLRSL